MPSRATFFLVFFAIGGLMLRDIISCQGRSDSHKSITLFR